MGGGGGPAEAEKWEALQKEGRPVPTFSPCAAPTARIAKRATMCAFMVAVCGGRGWGCVARAAEGRLENEKRIDLMKI